MGVTENARLAKASSVALGIAPGVFRNAALSAMARHLLAATPEILAENAADVSHAQAAGLSTAMVKRLTLSDGKIREMASALDEIAAMPDIIGEVMERICRPNGLEIQKVRVPMGVIGIIYESRPNVTSDAAGLCIKSGNAVVLRGGSETLRSNLAIVTALRSGLSEAGLSPECVQIVESTDRAEVATMLGLRDLLDLIIPRGGAGLIREVVMNSRVPVIETGAGNCHVYVDATADLERAVPIVINAKCQNPSVCNAIETLLVHERVAAEFLPGVVAALRAAGVLVKGCERVRVVVPVVETATERDWAEEYLDLTIAVRVVDDLDDAITHINHYGTKHSEAILTRDEAAAERFLNEIDAACVYVNASTRFTDGGEFGFGAEIGISTQKLHARGPMGLREMTSYKYVVRGSGQVR